MVDRRWWRMIPHKKSQFYLKKLIFYQVNLQNRSAGRLFDHID